MNRPRIPRLIVTLIITIGGLLMLSPKPDSPAAPELANPSFEDARPLQGWESAGVVESQGHGGGSRLTHLGGNDALESTQRLRGIARGWYTLRVWVRSSGGPIEAYIALKDCGNGEARASVPSLPDEWLQIVVSAYITNHECTISLHSDAPAGEWVSFDALEFAPGRATLSVLGADISSLKKSEELGGVYAYADGTRADALEILRSHGLNYARLRVWVDSPDGYHGLSQVLEMARRLKQHGIGLLVDFHYSDSWADPGQQPKPAAWADLDFAGLRQALYDHTYAVCRELKAQDTPPDIVQIGNEITNGMLWPDGRNDTSFDQLAALLRAGHRAVKDCSPATQVMLHLDNGGNNRLYRWWFDSVLERDVPFDLIGVSYYPYWHGTLADLQNNLNDLALRYDRDLIVVETAYAFTPDDHDGHANIIHSEARPGYPFSPEGQARMLADIMTVVRAVPNGRGLGVLWWDATWTAVPGNGWDPRDPASGNGWENQALFDFQNRALPAMDLFKEP